MWLSESAFMNSSGVYNALLSATVTHFNPRAFVYTAQTIFQVGQLSVITSLLRSETNALRIESCNEALTELISLFTVREFPLFPLSPLFT